MYSRVPVGLNSCTRQKTTKHFLPWTSGQFVLEFQGYLLYMWLIFLRLFLSQEETTEMNRSRVIARGS